MKNDIILLSNIIFLLIPLDIIYIFIKKYQVLCNARIGYELIETLIKLYSNGKIIILNKKEEETPEEEMSKDLISIMNIYVAKVNGLRKYKTSIKKEISNNNKK